MPRSGGREPIEGLPPADTSVLLGFVRSDQQFDWILRTRLYNMRSDPERNGSVSVNSRHSSAQVLVLYSEKEILGVWRLSEIASVVTAKQLLALGYPSPRGSAYVCVQLVGIISETATLGLNHARVRSLAETLAKPFGSPALSSWAALTS
jgi:hypothetical protein